MSDTRLWRLLSRLGDVLWGTKQDFELRCDLTRALPSSKPAKCPIEMRPVDPRMFDGFNKELRRREAEYTKVLIRSWYCRAGVGTLYVAHSGDDPVYAQWLTNPEQQRRIPRFLPGRMPELKPHDLLLEGAYTFVDYRRLGAMRAGMAQLVRFAKQAGASAVLTYVATDNIPSLRGCADVGFVPNRVRVSTRRILRWTNDQPVDQEHWASWRTATAKAGQPAQLDPKAGTRSPQPGRAA